MRDCDMHVRSRFRRRSQKLGEGADSPASTLTCLEPIKVAVFDGDVASVNDAATQGHRAVCRRVRHVLLELHVGVPLELPCEQEQPEDSFMHTRLRRVPDHLPTLALLGYLELFLKRNSCRSIQEKTLHYHVCLYGCRLTIMQRCCILACSKGNKTHTSNVTCTCEPTQNKTIEDTCFLVMHQLHVLDGPAHSELGFEVLNGCARAHISYPYLCS